MPAVKGVGEPCAGEPHARFEVAAGGNRNQSGQHVPHGTRRLPPTRPSAAAPYAPAFAGRDPRLKPLKPPGDDRVEAKVR
jgi:hypothetical protein